MNLALISCSLSPTSHSAVMARHLADRSRELGALVDWIDLREWPLPFCDGDASYADPNVELLTARIERADAIALAMPVYNYDVGGAARNLIALTGSAWNEKIVGMIAAAGGQSSYMSLMPLANSLMLDFRCVIIPRFVYANGRSFESGELRDPAIHDRLSRLAKELVRFSSALGTVLASEQAAT